MQHAADISPRLAIPVVILGYFLAGLAVWITLILYGVYFNWSMAVGWPPPPKLPTLLMLVSMR